MRRTSIITALLANEIQFSIVTPKQAIQNVQAGKFRALAVTASTRDDKMPDVPTVEQALGIKDYDVRSWFAIPMRTWPSTYVGAPLA